MKDEGKEITARATEIAVFWNHLVDYGAHSNDAIEGRARYWACMHIIAHMAAAIGHEDEKTFIANLVEDIDKFVPQIRQMIAEERDHDH